MTFIETIKLKNGVIFHLEYHQKRVDETFSTVFKTNRVLNLSEICKTLLLPQKGFYKIRIEYGVNQWKSEIIPYQIRSISQLEIVPCNTISYPLKSSNRTCFEILKKTTNSEIIIIKNGFVTDSTFSNLAFYKNNKWFTPIHFLLNGTCRQRLLNEKKIEEIPIALTDIFSFEKVALINAMIDLEELCIETTNINLNKY